MKGKRITEWIFSGGNYTEQYPDGYIEFDAALPLTVKNIDSKGKFIYFTLFNTEGQHFYIMHSLMMTGRWQRSHDEYCKWFVEVDDGKTLWFRDPRAFATVKFTSDIDILNDKLNHLGPDIMTPEFSLPVFQDLVKRYATRNICAFLMDQSVIAGCGNYIKAEVLYDAKISPMRKMNSLSDNEVDLLYQALCVIPRVAYNNKGVSLRDYADENGKQGYYSNKLKVYGNRLARRTKTADGRTTYWDPDHQH